MYLSYSGYKKLITCLFAYWHEYINKTPKDGVDDRLGSIYGSVSGILFEDFYVLRMWANPRPQEALLARVESTVDKVIKKETSKGGVLVWKGPEAEGLNPKALYTNREELIADVRDTVPRGLRIIRQHRLLGPRTDAEFKLDLEFEGHVLAGRADFIIHRLKPDDDLLIVDGKGSKHRGKYVDPTQLFWYAMLFWLQSMKQGSPRLPDKLAFLFWKFNPDESMDWLDVSESDVSDLLESTQEAIRKIEGLKKMLLPNAPVDAVRGVFTPNASEESCRFCPYASKCPPGEKVKKLIELKSKKSK